MREGRRIISPIGEGGRANRNSGWLFTRVVGTIMTIGVSMTQGKKALKIASLLCGRGDLFTEQTRDNTYCPLVIRRRKKGKEKMKYIDGVYRI